MEVISLSETKNGGELIYKFKFADDNHITRKNARVGEIAPLEDPISEGVRETRNPPHRFRKKRSVKPFQVSKTETPISLSRAKLLPVPQLVFRFSSILPHQKFNAELWSSQMRLFGSLKQHIA